MAFCFNSLRSSTLFNEIILTSLHASGYEGLTPALLELFAYLADAEPPSVSALAKSMGYTRQAAHKSVGKLEKTGYVRLETRPQNRKEKIVFLTPKGDALVRQSLEVIARTEAKMAAFVGADAFASYLRMQDELTAFLAQLEAEANP